MQLESLKVTNQVMGTNTMAKIGYEIAIFLGYSEEEARKFTSHTWRRSAATNMAANGASTEQIKHADNWKSISVAQRYIDSSTRMKTHIANFMSNSKEFFESDVDSAVTENVSKRPKCHGRTKESDVDSVLTENVSKRQQNESESFQSDNATVSNVYNGNVYHVAGNVIITNTNEKDLKFVFPKNIANKENCK